MNRKIIFFILFGILLVGILGGLYMTEKEEKKYQGPVRLQDDEKYFRETGITKHLEDLNGQEDK